MARAKKVSKGNTTTECHNVLDGMAKVFRVKQSGKVWQFRMYIAEEQKTYRKSLKTSDLDTAKERARKAGTKIMSDVSAGKKIFGLKLQDAIDYYLDYRDKNHVAVGSITAERLVTIKSGLKHLVTMLGGDTRISELDANTLKNYKRKRLEVAKAADVTIRNEQAMLNHFMRFLYEENLSHFSEFRFEKIRIIKDDVGKRDTFTFDEYKQLTRFMNSKQYCKEKGISDDVRREREFVKNYVLISTNTCMRVGELRQLKWSDLIKLEKGKDDNDVQTVWAYINIRAETSKVRASRRVIARGGEYFQRIKQLQKYSDSSHYIFSALDSTAQFSARRWAMHWDLLMSGIGIDRSSWKDRNLTWYSLRHFGITCRVTAGVNVVDLADMAGTSISHIEKTYYHSRDAHKLAQASKTFSMNDYLGKENMVGNE